MPNIQLCAGRKKYLELLFEDEKTYLCTTETRSASKNAYSSLLSLQSTFTHVLLVRENN
jgi:hypothetical protein